MEIFDVSGIGSSKGLAISMGDDFLPSNYYFLDPDIEPNPLPSARFDAAKKWQSLRIQSMPAVGRRAKPYFEDATGPGFYLPGCSFAVNDYARAKLEPILGDQVIFLPLEIAGAPCNYWVFYVTHYYGGVDLERSRFRAAQSYSEDKRKELRDVIFLDSPKLRELFVFRVPGTAEYFPFALGDFATRQFFDLVHDLKLGGFHFVKVIGKGEIIDPTVPPVLVSKGAKYVPDWT